MKKLSLNVDALTVESFDATPAGGAGRATVLAYQAAFTPACDPQEHSGEPCVYTLLTACAPECWP